MMEKYHEEWIAMILTRKTGGRLCALSQKTESPAIPFCRKYRMPDATVLSCIDLKAKAIGEVTPRHELPERSEPASIGQAWKDGRVILLPSHQTSPGEAWYMGTANAVYQNLQFVKRYNPHYVLILLGEHIYKVDYAKMLSFHQEKNAGCTIATVEVSVEEAKRFGVFSCDQNRRVVSFEEKPLYPKSNTASMDIYIFNAELLSYYLQMDMLNLYSCHDFGKDIIPAMLGNREVIYAYPFEGCGGNRFHQERQRRLGCYDFTNTENEQA